MSMNDIDTRDGLLYAGDLCSIPTASYLALLGNFPWQRVGESASGTLPNKKNPDKKDIAQFRFHDSLMRRIRSLETKIK